MVVAERVTVAEILLQVQADFVVTHSELHKVVGVGIVRQFDAKVGTGIAVPGHIVDISGGRFGEGQGVVVIGPCAVFSSVMDDLPVIGGNKAAVRHAEGLAGLGAVVDDLAEDVNIRRNRFGCFGVLVA